MSDQILLHEVPPLVKGVIIKRPSKHVKTPYVADVLYNNTEVLGHTPSLGCCGLVEPSKEVYMYALDNPKTKCDYRICIAKIEEKGHTMYIGVAPKMAEKIAYNAILHNCIPHLHVRTLKSEKKILNSRFDFIGMTKEDIPFVLEVKNVPLADYEDIYAKERKKKNYESNAWDSKVAYFPDGYRKKVKDTVSPRALKHVNELCELKTQYKDKIRCILLFVIQRTDVASFQPSRIDPIYLDAVRNAWKKGVELRTLQVQWIENKAYYYRNDLPITLFDDYNIWTNEVL